MSEIYEFLKEQLQNTNSLFLIITGACVTVLTVLTMFNTYRKGNHDFKSVKTQALLDLLKNDEWKKMNDMELAVRLQNGFGKEVEINKFRYAMQRSESYDLLTNLIEANFFIKITKNERNELIMENKLPFQKYPKYGHRIASLIFSVASFIPFLGAVLASAFAQNVLAVILMLAGMMMFVLHLMVDTQMSIARKLLKDIDKDFPLHLPEVQNAVANVATPASIEASAGNILGQDMPHIQAQAQIQRLRPHDETSH